MSDAALLGVDWGSSSVRAMRIAPDGRILEIRRSADGVFTASGDFATRLRANLGDWPSRHPSAPILLCGMIGSDRGWIPAPYVFTPAGLDELSQALVAAPFAGVVRIVPGVGSWNAGQAEVMRGEETLAMGFLAQAGLSDAILCLPGTHSKWVRMRFGRIEALRTYMTGELRAALLGQGSLATGIEQISSSAEFDRGLRSGDDALSHSLFQARARRLLGTLSAEHTASFVSGVLIGDEIAAEVKNAEKDVPLFLAARGALAEEYTAALVHADLAHTLVDPEPLAALGLARIARHAGLLLPV